ncbi:hypothetical protein M9H77_12362 [Catharanthus roseus]|uniref:Uncharacterized protein n=1 Tax=Catharanthus roseus TaxID=4058 RepID=A0ACC0BHC8_CATRO|nr:hypothetical protein M9H77_12362 [Catharanthus roseus]
MENLSESRRIAENNPPKVYVQGIVVFISATQAQAYGIVDLVANSTCQLLNNLLERQDSPSEMSRNPPLFGDVLNVEENVLGCMCDSFRSYHELVQKQENKLFGINN